MSAEQPIHNIDLNDIHFPPLRSHLDHEPVDLTPLTYILAASQMELSSRGYELDGPVQYELYPRVAGASSAKQEGALSVRVTRRRVDDPQRFEQIEMDLTENDAEDAVLATVILPAGQIREYKFNLDPEELEGLARLAEHIAIASN